MGFFCCFFIHCIFPEVSNFKKTHTHKMQSYTNSITTFLCQHMARSDFAIYTVGNDCKVNAHYKQGSLLDAATGGLPVQVPS
jgi:hypothetical protein